MCFYICTSAYIMRRYYKVFCFPISRPAKPTDVNKVIIRNDESDLRCWSSVGQQGGIQYIQLTQGCFVEEAVSHELMHSIGFLHEHQRPDRDEYVHVNESCIQKGKEHNFKIQKDLLTYGLKYRAKSIMHYSSDAFTIGNCQTITSKVSKFPF